MKTMTWGSNSLAQIWIRLSFPDWDKDGNVFLDAEAIEEMKLLVIAVRDDIKGDKANEQDVVWRKQRAGNSDHRPLVQGCWADNDSDEKDCK